jgi:cardiolipin synthase C
MMEAALILIITAVFAMAIFRFFKWERIPKSQPPPSCVLPVLDDQTKLDRMIAPLLSNQPDATGLRLLVDNIEAFAVRIESANHAERSLDLQYYYWKNDLTGKLLCAAIIRAANRGVRVRLLLDDINSHGLDTTYLALDSHENIEVRLFNPVANRKHQLQRLMELILRYSAKSNRMHNKSWIADGRMAVVGGRNIGDAYFDASKHVSFRDIDVLAIGQSVREAETIFDRYWNCKASISIRALHRFHNPKLAMLSRRLNAFEKRGDAKRFLNLVGHVTPSDSILQSASNFHWTKDVNIDADPPEKVIREKSKIWLAEKIQSRIQSAKTDIEIVSPYFIPGMSGVEDLRALVSRGVKVSVLTNSLAATDVIAVHGAYARYRKPILQNGVALFELKQQGAKKRSSLFGSSSASLHTKCFVIDGSEGFIGSFNFDPRSKAINTEMGIFFRHSKLASELQKNFKTQTSSRFSYRLEIQESKLTWRDDTTSQNGNWTHEPDTTFVRRLTAQIVGMLPIESQL